MQQLNHDDEEKLLAATDRTTEYVADGLVPNQAVEKVAKEMRLSPGFLRSVVTAYNTGRQLAQMEQNKTAADKFASFDLAKYDTIFASLWGKKADKTASQEKLAQVSSDWKTAPRLKPPVAKLSNVSLTKVASSPIENSNVPSQAGKLLNLHDEVRIKERAYKEARAAAAADKIKADSCFQAVKDYFQKSAYDRISFPLFAQTMTTYFGKKGEALVSAIQPNTSHEKHSAFYGQQVFIEAEPFKTASEALTAAVRSVHSAAACDRAEQAWLAKLAELEDSPLPDSWQPPAHYPNGSILSTQTVKKGNWGLVGASAVGATTKHVLDNALGGQQPANKVNKALLDFEDPEHEDELRKVEAEAMLTNIMSDPDNPISGHSADEILKAYNQLSQLAPHAVRQPAALQSLLSKRLAGHAEPFEIQEISKLENTLKPKSNNLLGMISDASSNIFN